MNAAAAAQEAPAKKEKSAKKGSDKAPKVEKEMEGHPDYHRIKIVMTDGTEYETRSCWGKEGDVMRLDVDPKNHPAWHGGAVKVIEKQQLKKFEGRFGTFLSGDVAGPASVNDKEKDKGSKKA